MFNVALSLHCAGTNVDIMFQLVTLIHAIHLYFAFIFFDQITFRPDQLHPGPFPP